ncbi:MAG: alpha-amylase family glycosyl hydrolase, partial [Planctomycetota bacterium]|nr:alpha-amylase family glycosyl hydrolase [Planctomycetota bacterium]
FVASLTPHILLMGTLSLCPASVSVAQDGPSTVPGVGAYVYDDGTNGVSFRIWAPNATQVHVLGSFNFWNATSHPLYPEPGGYWSVRVPYALPGSQYKFRIDNGYQVLERNDARSFDVTSSVGNSVVYDLGAYEWQNPDDLSIPFNELVIYEMHIGTFGVDDGSPGVGTLDGAIDRLDHLEELGVNAIELMPFFEFPGGNSWGYNPAHSFAVESEYGTPDDLKRFVDEARGRGIAVIADLVYNHLGPNDLGLWQYDGDEGGGGGIYFYNDDRANTPWGNTRPDYSRGEVRQWIRDNVFHWFDNFRFEGARVDGTKYIRMTNPPFGELPEGWSLLQWINEEVNQRSPGKIMIAEDFDNNEWISKDVGAGGAGFDSQWDARFFYPVRNAVQTVADADRSMWDVRDAIISSFNGNHTHRVIYTESHDEVANGRARVPEDIWPGNADSWFSKKRSTLAAGLVFTSPGIPMLFQGQEFLEDGYFRDDDPLDWSKVDRFSGILEMYRRMISLRRNLTGVTRGLSGGNTNVHHVNNNEKLVAFHRWDQGGVGDDVVVVANFSDQYWNNYRIGFPSAGLWKAHFNSDDSAYDADFDGYGGFDLQTEQLPRDGMGQSGVVKIGPYSVVIFSQGEESSEEEPPAGIVGDYNDDGLVNGFDLGLLLGVWGMDSQLYDLNGDLLVNGADLSMLLANWTR